MFVTSFCNCFVCIWDKSIFSLFSWYKTISKYMFISMIYFWIMFISESSILFLAFVLLTHILLLLLRFLFFVYFVSQSWFLCYLVHIPNNFLLNCGFYCESSPFCCASCSWLDFFFAPCFCLPGGHLCHPSFLAFLSRLVLGPSLVHSLDSRVCCVSSLTCRRCVSPFPWHHCDDETCFLSVFSFRVTCLLCCFFPSVSLIQNTCGPAPPPPPLRPPPCSWWGPGPAHCWGAAARWAPSLCSRLCRPSRALSQRLCCQSAWCS